MHVYTPTSLCEWTLQSYIRSPVGDNGNFGVSVAIDNLRVAVGANAWRKLQLFLFFNWIFLTILFLEGYTGKAFIFTFIQDQYWELEDTLVSPIPSPVGKGFGHSVALSGKHAVIGSGSNSCEWCFHSCLFAWLTLSQCSSTSTARVAGR